jgi:hypothetical protein
MVLSLYVLGLSVIEVFFVSAFSFELSDVPKVSSGIIKSLDITISGTIDGPLI